MVHFLSLGPQLKSTFPLSTLPKFLISKWSSKVQSHGLPLFSSSKFFSIGYIDHLHPLQAGSSYLHVVLGGYSIPPGDLITIKLSLGEEQQSPASGNGGPGCSDPFLQR